MRKKVVWLIISSFFVSVLVSVASCTPVATTEEEKETSSSLVEEKGEEAISPPVEEEEVKDPVLATIKLDTTSSTWREGEEPYDIYSAIKEKLEEAGIEVASEGNGDYDALLNVNYEEAKGGEYGAAAAGGMAGGSGYGTEISCDLTLHDKKGKLLLEITISSGTSYSVSSKDDLYSSSIRNLEREVYYKYLGEIVATEFSTGDELSVLVSALEDEYYTRCDAVVALGELGDVRAVEPLVTCLLEDSTFNVRAAAARALGTLNDVNAVEPLIDALSDEDSYVRECAATALGDIGDIRAIQPLTATLSDEDVGVYYAAKEALEKINAK